MPRSDSPSGPIDRSANRPPFDRLPQAELGHDELTDEQAEAVMAERARLLAQVPEEQYDKSNVFEVMVFHLGSQALAIEIRFVREVNAVGDITPIPFAPKFFVGVTNLRGEVLSVIDLRPLLGISSEEIETTKLIVLGDSRNEFGIIVDEVKEVTDLPMDDVRDPAGSVVPAVRRYLHGVTENALMVVDGEALLTDEQLYIADDD